MANLERLQTIFFGDLSFQKTTEITMNVLPSVFTFVTGNRCLRKLQTTNLICNVLYFVASNRIGVSESIERVLTTNSSSHILSFVCCVNILNSILYGSRYASTYIQTDCYTYWGNSPSDKRSCFWRGWDIDSTRYTITNRWIHQHRSNQLQTHPRGCQCSHWCGYFPIYSIALYRRWIQTSYGCCWKRGVEGGRKYTVAARYHGDSKRRNQ